MSARQKESPAEGDCRFANCVSMYADGELAADHAMEVEEHLAECSDCMERLELLRATRSSLKRRCSSPGVPPALRARVCAAMMGASSGKRSSETMPSEAVGTSLDGATFDADGKSDGAQDGAPRNQPRLIKLRYAVAMAAAAGIVFAMGAWRMRMDAPMARNANPGDGAFNTGSMSTGSLPSGGAHFDRMLDELVSLHANPLPPETTNPEELQRFDPLVGVPVRRPAFRPFGGDFNGARVHAMRDRRAAILHYTVRGKHRVTVYVFNPQELPMRDPRLEQRVVRTRPVYVGQLRGYSVAATEDRGVGYALATDLDRTQSAELVLAAHQP